MDNYYLKIEYKYNMYQLTKNMIIILMIKIIF